MTLLLILIAAALLGGNAMAQDEKPGRPSGRTASNVTHEGVDLTWNAPSSGAAVDHYKVHRRDISTPGTTLTEIGTSTGTEGSKLRRVGTSTDTSYSDTGLEAETNYLYRVDAVPPSGKASRKPDRAEVTTPSETPAQVRSVGTAQNSGDNPVTVTWSASTGATKYQVEREKIPTTEEDRDVFDVGNATSYEDNSTECNTKYSYRVRAGNDNGYGPWSSGARITTMRQPGTPDKPGNLSATSNSDGSISLTWTAPSGTETVTGYSVNRRDMGDGTETELATPDSGTTSHTDSDVTAGTTYAYWVYATNSVGDGPTTSWETIEAQEAQTNPPDKPKTITLSEDTAGEIVVAWTPATTGPDADQYRVYRHVIDGNGTMTLFATVDAPTTSHTDATVEEETWYGYQVTAVNSGGESSANGPRSIKSKNQTPGIPEEVTRIGLSEEAAGEVVVTWTPGEGGEAATGFKIFRKRLSPGGEHGTSDVEVGTAAAGAASHTDGDSIPCNADTDQGADTQIYPAPRAVTPFEGRTTDDSLTQEAQEALLTGQPGAVAATTPQAAINIAYCLPDQELAEQVIVRSAASQADFSGETKSCLATEAGGQTVRRMLLERAGGGESTLLVPVLEYAVAIHWATCLNVQEWQETGMTERDQAHARCLTAGEGGIDAVISLMLDEAPPEESDKTAKHAAHCAAMHPAEPLPECGPPGPDGTRECP